jgi:hypothetical protein
MELTEMRQTRDRLFDEIAESDCVKASDLESIAMGSPHRSAEHYPLWLQRSIGEYINVCHEIGKPEQRLYREALAAR